MKRRFLLFTCLLISYAGIAQLEIADLAATAASDNVLRYNVTFTTNEDARSYVLWSRDLGGGELEEQHSWISDLDVSHSFTLLGFVANTTYTYQVVCWNSGSYIMSDPLQFTTGALPSDVGISTNIFTNSGNLQGFYMTNTLNTPDRTLQMFNRAGEVVWYNWHSGVDGFGGIGNCQMWDITDEGHTLTLECHAFQERDLNGNVLVDVNFNGTDYDTLFFHHDVIRNAAGNYVAVTAERRYFDFTPNGGIANQAVIGEGLLEFDASGNVLWYWTTFDHFDPVAMNATSQNAFFTPMFGASAINWQHCNAVHQDYDGNYLLSFKEFNQVMKVDRETGELLWQISGNNPTVQLQNDFGFGDQHDITNQDENEYILFDNTGAGTQSRIVEFAVDYYETPTAYVTWSYNFGDSIASPILGTARKLANGNRVGVCGAPGANPAKKGHIVEVTEEGEVVWHMKQNTWIYRAYYYDELFDDQSNLALSVPQINESICPGVEPFVIPAQPQGGFWSGPGMTNGIFDPSEAGEGIHTVYYQYGWLIDSTHVNVLNNAETMNTNAAICFGEGILLGGEMQTAPGIYMDVFENALGCDSTVFTTLVVNEENLTSQNLTICEGDSILLGGEWQFEGGVFTDIFTNQFGCDSALVTILGVTDLPQQPEIVFVSGEGFDQTLSSSSAGNSYQWYFDGELQGGLTTQTISTSGFDWGNGGTVQVIVVVGNCLSPVSDSYDIISGVNELSSFNIVISPNPTNGQVNITGDFMTFGLEKIEAYNSVGELILEKRITDLSTEVLDFGEYPAGIYNIKFYSSVFAPTSAMVVKN